jgi:hypothetical protein
MNNSSEKSKNLNSEKRKNLKLKSILVSLSLLLWTLSYPAEPSHAASISRETLAKLNETGTININSISWYIKIDESIWWFADWEYKLKEWIIKQVSAKHINITNDRWKRITIWLHDPFILFLKFEKKKGIVRFEKNLWLLLDKRWHYLYLLWIVINHKFYPLRNPERFKITKIKEVIEKEGNKIIIKEWGEQTLTIPIPPITSYWIKWWKIILKISTD